MGAMDSCTSSATSKPWQRPSCSSPSIVNWLAPWAKKGRAKHARNSPLIASCQCTKRSTRGSVLVLSDAANVEDGEAELQDDQSVSLGWPAPGHPKHVAEEKNPEAPLAFLF